MLFSGIINLVQNDSRDSRISKLPPHLHDAGLLPTHHQNVCQNFPATRVSETTSVPVDLENFTICGLVKQPPFKVDLRYCHLEFETKQTSLPINDTRCFKNTLRGCQLWVVHYTRLCIFPFSGKCQLSTASCHRNSIRSGKSFNIFKTFAHI